jgi:hypothetical protein
MYPEIRVNKSQQMYKDIMKSFKKKKNNRLKIST